MWLTFFILLSCFEVSANGEEASTTNDVVPKSPSDSQTGDAPSAGRGDSTAIHALSINDVAETSNAASTEVFTDPPDPATAVTTISSDDSLGCLSKAIELLTAAGGLEGVAPEKLTEVVRKH